MENGNQKIVNTAIRRAEFKPNLTAVHKIASANQAYTLKVNAISLAMNCSL